VVPISSYQRVAGPQAGSSGIWAKTDHPPAEVGIFRNEFIRTLSCTVSKVFGKYGVSLPSGEQVEQVEQGSLRRKCYPMLLILIIVLGVEVLPPSSDMVEKNQ
jgi:hypothetical protein